MAISLEQRFSLSLLCSICLRLRFVFRVQLFSHTVILFDDDAVR